MNSIKKILSVIKEKAHQTYEGDKTKDFFAAIQRNDYKKVEGYLVNHVNPNIRNAQGVPALFLAAKLGNVKTVEVLLKFNASLACTPLKKNLKENTVTLLEMVRRNIRECKSLNPSNKLAPLKNYEEIDKLFTIQSLEADRKALETWKEEDRKTKLKEQETSIIESLIMETPKTTEYDEFASDETRESIFYRPLR